MVCCFANLCALHFCVFVRLFRALLGKEAAMQARVAEFHATALEFTKGEKVRRAAAGRGRPRALTRARMTRVAAVATAAAAAWSGGRPGARASAQRSRPLRNFSRPVVVARALSRAN